jgi:amino acid transporter
MDRSPAFSSFLWLPRVCRICEIVATGLFSAAMHPNLGAMEARLEQYIHAIIRWLPDPILSILILIASFGAGWLLHNIISRILTRLTEKRDLFWRSLVQRTKRPLRLAILTWTLSLGVVIAPLSNEGESTLRHILLLCFIVVVGWMARTTLHIWTTVYLRRFKLDAEDNLLARKHVTQSRILERVAATLIIALTLSAVIMTFPAARQYGVSLLASAGVAGIVLGLALQPRPEEPVRRHPARHHPADPHRRCAAGGGGSGAR